MPGLKLFTSNRMEVLADRLAEVLRQNPASPLDKEIVVVQSKGMERWVSMEIARRHGICANIGFPFPNAFVYDVFTKVIGGIPEHSPFDPPVMTWRIMGLLPLCLAMDQFEPLRNYLDDDQRHLKQFQLAQRIAYLFDQYLLYRPDMILEWEMGEADHWQAVLWRELSSGYESLHGPALRRSFLAKVRDPSSLINNVPERVSVFGISSLPPFHMEVFSELSRFSRVNLFLMNPCREFWADIKSDREISGITKRSGRKDLNPQELYLEKGNSLLASLGILGRDFFQLIQLSTGEEEELFERPVEDNLLHCLQADILDLTDRDPASKTEIPRDDRSVSIHSCHSPMREIEVIYDHLLRLIQEEPDLSPKDILVMAPDINVHAPFIHAVFDAPEDPDSRVPFSITDRSIRKDSHIIDSFLAILDLSGSRFSAPKVLSLLESTALRRKFGLSIEDVDLIRQWVTATRIRWGVDEDERARMGLSRFRENTWGAGLDRLLLGYAMPGKGAKMFRSILPFDDVEGGDGEVLGKLMEFTDRLFSNVGGLAQSRTLEEWSRYLALLLDRFFEPDTVSEREAQTMRQTLNDLAVKQGLSSFHSPVELEVIRAFLRGRLETESVGLGFITGGVTFCSMLPMRSIPFEVICLVGMDDGAFPRQTRALGFDLMARAPRPCDRSQRNDDRYLFLEALLSARRRLIISYVGQSAEDNSAIPPSVLVSELTDVIEKGFLHPSGSILDRITTTHRLQPFSVQYFQNLDDKYFSYSADNCGAAVHCCTERKGPEPFISGGLPEPEEEWRTVDIDQLCRFFANPARFLLTQRLSMHIEALEQAVEDREPFELGGLDRYFLEEELLDKLIGHKTTEDLLPLMRASGRLPHGVVGICGFEMMHREVGRLQARIERLLQGIPLPPKEVDLTVEPFHITGHINGITTTGLLHYRSARVKARDRLNLWLHHLALNAMHESDHAMTTFLLGSDCGFEYSPVENASQTLAALLDVYWNGLRKPLHFFPQTSFAYARSIFEGKPEEASLKAARREWEGDQYKKAEKAEGHLALCFRAEDPLDEQFCELAMEIFGPLLSSEKQLE
jgi:exodeoxyribonuclease V gamma subunit